jgi:hypothetical protein
MIPFPFAAPSPFPSTFQFLSFDENSGLELRRDAVYDSDAIVLTYDNNQLGYAYLPSPVQLLQDNTSGLCAPLSFLSRFSFVISDKGPTGWGSGFTFHLLGASVVDKQDISSGSGADMGLSYGWDTPYTPGILAVEFDTYQDASVNDIVAGHLGINLGYGGFSAISVATKPFGILLNDTKVKSALVQYSSASLTLSVFLAYNRSKPAKPFLQYKVDLCEQLRNFCNGCWELNSAYIGFSAQTTDNYETVQILDWDFSTSL